MDLIYEAAKAYENLLHKQYRIIVGRKEKALHITLTFDESEFYHLCGLHKLVDIEKLNIPNQKKVFAYILQEKITDAYCAKSKYFNLIKGRISLLVNLEDFIDSNKTIYIKYDMKKNTRSSIKADFLLKGTDSSGNQYLFLCKLKSKKDTYCCISLFPRDKKEFDYAEKQESYKLLYKEKINIKTGEKEVLFLSQSYKA